jgi:hypothetical protein
MVRMAFEIDLREFDIEGADGPAPGNSCRSASTCRLHPHPTGKPVTPRVQR